MPDYLPVVGGKMYPYGESALVLDVTSKDTLATQRQLWALKETMDPLKISDAEHDDANSIFTDIVLGNNNLTFVFEPLQSTFEALAPMVKKCWNEVRLKAVPKHAQVTHQLTACFGGEYGPDLLPLAESKSISADALIEQYCAQNYVVLFLGFQAGFAYLHGLPDTLHAPRLESPRMRVPVGSIAIGGVQTGIYPNTSPGGWQIIGKVDDSHLPLFSLDRNPPNQFKPGDQIRFLAKTA